MYLKRNSTATVLSEDFEFSARKLDQTLLTDPGQFQSLLQQKDILIKKLQQKIVQQEYLIDQLLRQSDQQVHTHKRRLSIVKFQSQSQNKPKKTKTNSFLKQYVQLEREACFIEGFEIVKNVQSFIAQVTQCLQKNFQQQIQTLSSQIQYRSQIVVQLARTNSRLNEQLMSQQTVNSALTSQLRSFQNLVTIILQSLQKAKNLQTEADPLEKYGSLLDEIQDHLQNSKRCKTFNSSRNSDYEHDRKVSCLKQVQDKMALKEKITNYKRKIKLLEKQNAQTKSLLDQVIIVMNKSKES